MSKRSSSSAEPTAKRISTADGTASVGVGVRRYFHGSKARACAYEPTARVEKELYFLSNFYRSPLVLDGLEYATAEHYYQSAKYRGVNDEHAERIRTASSPTLAKRLGRSRKIPMCSDWASGETVGLKPCDIAMRRALRAKFEQNADLRALLLATGSASLHEDAPNDPYWGVCGADRLGIELCRLRDELRAPTVAAQSTGSSSSNETEEDDE